MAAKSIKLGAKSRSLDVMTFNMSQPALIEASAGTGKTYTITNLVLRALLGVGRAGCNLERPLQLEEMLIVTFTNAATADLRKRIYNRIREARVYLEHFLDYALGQVLYSLQMEGVSSEQEAALWESKSGRAQARSLILRKKHQLKYGLNAQVADTQESEASGKDEAAATAAAEAALGRELELEDEENEALYQSSSFSDAELDELFVEFRLDKLIAKAQKEQVLSSDQVLAQILSELLQRTGVLSQGNLSRAEGKITSAQNAAMDAAAAAADDDASARNGTLLQDNHSTSLLRRAVHVLMRAEREINNAAICTIHSFCGMALTQIYALESGEAFNNELKTDLQNEIHESCYAVWRRLFYKKNSSQKLLSDLMHQGSPWRVRNAPVNDPISFYQRIRTLNAVRLSDRNSGFFGYQLLGMEELLETCHLKLDYERPLEAQLVDYIERLEEFLHQLYGQLLAVSKSFVKVTPLSRFAAFYDFTRECFSSELLRINPKLDTSSASRAYLGKIASFYELIEQEELLQGSLQQLKSELSNFVHPQQTIHEESLQEQSLRSLLEKQEDEEQQLLLQLFNTAQSIIASKGQALRNLRKGGKGADNDIAPLTMLVGELTAVLEQVVGDNADFLNQVKYLLRTLVSIAINDEIDRTCKDLHVMSADEVLRRLDFALNSRAELGLRLATDIRTRYPLAMIDEFQDTDPVQFSIFSSIYLNQEALEKHAYCYLIGDPKQSIYAFRGSDINSYLKAKHKVLELTSDQGLYTLDTNYRSAPDIVYANNALFAPWFNERNVNPFDEANISFSPVYSKLEKALLSSELSKKQKQLLWECSLKSRPDFVFNGAQELKEQVLKEKGNSLHDALAANKPKSAPSFKSHAIEQNDAEDAAAAAADSSTRDSATTSTSTGAGHSFEDDFFVGAVGNNSYIVNVGEAGNKGALGQRYASALAQLVLRLLHSGWIRAEDGSMRRVTSGDIAILVRSSTENSLVQEKLWELQIPSVYYSDQSSVLSNGDGAPSAECLELSYLMEAMCDCTNRNKISRLLGSRMLNLSTEEFLSLTNDEHFEQEVKILDQCAKTWQQYGFLPAFLQWGNDPLHNQCKRLLELKDGERLYTNYCHISEIVQSVHQQKGGIAAQMHWFYELIYQNQGLFDQDVTKKRLESEQEQIKILTVHKSKGLEFPIVFMPFLWSTSMTSEGEDEYYGVTKYYDSEHYQHTVLDFNPEHEIEVTKLELKDGYTGQKDVMPVLYDELLPLGQRGKKERTRSKAAAAAAATAAAANAAGDAGAADAAAENGQRLKLPRYLQAQKVKIEAKEQSLLEDEREQMRLLYVAVTRAKLANFFFVGTANNARGAPTALARMQGSDTSPLDPSEFIARASAKPQLFTVLNGEVLLPDTERTSSKENSYPSMALSLEEAQKVFAHDRPPVGERIASDESTAKSASATASADATADAEHVQPYAISFLYKNAVDRSFNFFSYSSLVEGNDNYKQASSLVRSVYDLESEDQAQNNLHDGANDSLYINLISGAQAQGAGVGAAGADAGAGASAGAGAGSAGEVPVRLNAGALPTRGEYSLGDERYSVSALMQHYWQNNFCFINGRVQNRLGSISLDFLRGITPGLFMHAILQNVDFEQIKIQGWYSYLISHVMEVIGATNDYARMASALSVRMHTAQWEQNATLKQRLGEWFNDVLEAPIVQGKYHCLALSDLEPISYEREMEFLMANERFSTKDLDKICRQVAKQLLPPKIQKVLLPTLTLEGRSLVGYCKGSIDLACRFDLNKRLNLRTRSDLKEQLPDDIKEQLQNNLYALQEKLESVKAGDGSLLSLYKHDGELVDTESSEQPDVKYYVIDYKSNYLGESMADYEYDQLLSSIYIHRYDVQFLIYTLALYRFLKRRMGVSFNASYQELEDFYERHVGGVIYLYLRGLQANYLRDQISTGVFSTKIDFAVVHKLDCIFTGES